MCLLVGLASCNVQKKAVTRPAAKHSLPRIERPNTPAPRGGTPSILGRRILDEAATWLGTPYSYGSHAKGIGTDCSGFVMEVYERGADMKIPRNTRLQYEACQRVPRQELVPGDLVFFSGVKGGAVGHVGIYAGEGRMMHASSSRGVVLGNLDDRYWAERWAGGGRLLPSEAETPAQRIERMQRIQRAIDAEIDAAIDEELWFD